jgi:hypothetical protein
MIFFLRLKMNSFLLIYLLPPPVERELLLPPLEREEVPPLLEREELLPPE